MSRSTPVVIWILLGVLWLAGLPLRPLFDPDEGRYAEIPREMLSNGDWVTPTLNGLKYFEKPPLQYWATASLYATLGIHEWTARLWSVSLAFLCLPLVFAFARRIGYPTDTALIAAALLAINPYFALMGQLNLLDTGFTFFLSAAAFMFVIAQREHPRPGRSRNWMLLTWTALALAVLSKGIVALVLAGATLLIHAIWTRDAACLRRLHLARGVPLFLALTVPWFWIVQSRNPEFFQFFFVREHFQRYFTTIHERLEPLWFFIPILLFALLPLAGNWRSWRLARIEAPSQPGAFRAELFLLLWCAVVVVFFSFSQSKLPTYVMPVMPALSVALAGVTQAHSKAFHRAKWISMSCLLVLAVGVVIAARWNMRTMSERALLWAAAMAAICVGYLIVEDRRPQRALSHRWMALAAVSIAGYQLLSLVYASSFPGQSTQALAAGFAGHIPADMPVYSVSQYRHSLAFYLRRPLTVYDYAGELEFGMRQAGERPEDHGRHEFLERWQHETRAIAFVDPTAYAALRAAGMPGRILARDEWSVVIART